MPRRSPARKPSHRYHHGDLRRALIQEAVRMIGEDGLGALTLRAAGQRLGVSRTALYRHFADKAAPVAAVARDGFQRFREDLVSAWNEHGRGTAGFDAMGLAYVRFALAHPAHYRVMFGSIRDSGKDDPELQAVAAAAFQALVDALAELQQRDAIRHDDLQTLALYIWSVVHGVAMLAIDGQLGPDPSAAEALLRFSLAHVHTGIELRS